MRYYEAKQYLNRAVRLLKTEDSNQYKYAALELRFCLESITFQKLKRYEHLIPPSVGKIWQSGKLFKALIVLEPNAGKTCSVSIAAETPTGTGKQFSLGKQVFFTPKWLQKNYNKLGNLLHIGDTKFDTKEYLNELIETVKPVLNSTIHINLESREYLPCGKCANKIPINIEVIGSRQRYECLEEKCGYDHHLVTLDTGALKLIPVGFMLDCKCGHRIEFNSRKIALNNKFTCEECKREFVIDKFGASLLNDLED